MDVVPIRQVTPAAGPHIVRAPDEIAPGERGTLEFAAFEAAALTAPIDNPVWIDVGTAACVAPCG